MPVYVDELVDHSETGAACVRRHGPLWCHMFADTVAELHTLAGRIGMRQAWFQGPPRHILPHYDLTPSRRAQAVAAGAIELDYDRDEDVLIMRRIRRQYREARLEQKGQT